jgi:DDE superfamily endonuclease
MGLHLDEISQAVSPGAHAVVLLDQAGWHTSAKLKVPANISLLPLPPKSPELNPAENVGSICVTTGCPIASSLQDATSLITAATRGTNSWISRGPPCPSDFVTGHMVIVSEGWY